MLKRLSCLLTIKSGQFFKTRNFEADHIYSIRHLPLNQFDELILVCKDSELTQDYIDFVGSISPDLRVPLTLSGRIKSEDDAVRLFDLGADRIILNTALWNSPELARKLSNRFGRQAIVGSFDLLKDDKANVLSYDWVQRQARTSLLPTSFARYNEYFGEIMIQDVSRDGRVVGPDLPLYSSFIKQMPFDMPIHIGSSALTSWAHYVSMFGLDSVDAVASTNIHHMSETALRELRASCKINNISVRNA